MSDWPAVERRIRSLPDANPLAVVLGGGAGGLSYARSLGRRGIPMLLLDTRGGFAGRSRYVWPLTLRGPLEHPDDWVELLDRVSARLATPAALLPTNDVLTALIAKNAEHLEKSFRFIVPSWDIVRSIVDKRSQYEHAQRAGIPIPATYFPETVAEAEAIAATVRYPCLFKPYESALGRVAMRSAPGGAKAQSKALFLHDGDELVTSFARYASPETRFMVQEFVPGDDSALLGYFAFWDAEGRERAWLTKQKIRQFPLVLGSGSFQTTVNAPEVADLSRKLLQSFGFRGLVNVEFKFDARDGTHRLIEINPRSASANQIAVSAGVDFPWLVYQYLTRTEDLPSPAFRPGVKWVNEDLDLQAFLAMRATGDLTLWRWIRSLRGTRSWAVATPRDPLPFVFQALSHIRSPAAPRRR